MTQATLAKIIADFETSLATKMAVGATTATLLSATDDDSVALPAGRYFFTIDGDNSQKEHISCTLSSTSLSAIKTVSRQGTETSGCLRTHRVGAKVVITDFAHIKKINDLLDGTTPLDSSVPLTYSAEPTFTDGLHQLVTFDKSKAYTDGVAVAGAPNASTTVKGIVEIATTAEINAGTGTGATGAVIAVSPDNLASSNYGLNTPTANEKAALAGTSGTAPSGSNKLVDAADVSATAVASKVIRANASAKIASTFLNIGLFGDYSDGDVTVSSPTTLTRDMYYNVLTVTSTISTAGFKIYAKSVLGGGTIQNNGSVGGNASGTTGGTGGAGATAGSLPGGTAGSAGTSPTGGAGVAGSAAAKCIGSVGAAGGAAGRGDQPSGGAGGAGGTKTGTVYNQLNTPFEINSLFDISPSLAVLTVSCGAGGGGGAGGSGSITSGAGGGGGGSGGLVWVAAESISNVTLKATGGNGGNATGGGSGGGGTWGSGGGGAGGNGGVVILLYITKSSVTETVTGGTGGSIGSDPGGGGAGAGNTGTTGVVYEVQI